MNRFSKIRAPDSCSDKCDRVSAQKTRRRLHPHHAGDATAIIDVGGRALRAEVETVAFAQLIAAVVDSQLDGTIEHVAEFLAFMLQGASAAATGLEVVDVPEKQVPAAGRDQRSEPCSPAPAELSRLNSWPLASAQDDVVGPS